MTNSLFQKWRKFSFEWFGKWRGAFCMTQRWGGGGHPFICSGKWAPSVWPRVKRNLFCDPAVRKLPVKWFRDWGGIPGVIQRRGGAPLVWSWNGGAALCSARRLVGHPPLVWPTDRGHRPYRMGFFGVSLRTITYLFIKVRERLGWVPITLFDDFGGYPLNHFISSLGGLLKTSGDLREHALKIWS